MITGIVSTFASGINQKGFSNVEKLNLSEKHLLLVLDNRSYKAGVDRSVPHRTVPHWTVPQMNIQVKKLYTRYHHGE